MKLASTIILAFISLLCEAQMSVSLSVPTDTVILGQPVVAKYQINGPLSNVQQLDFSPLLNMDNLAYPNDSSRLDKIMDVSISAPAIGVSSDQPILRGEGLTANTGEVTMTFYSMGVVSVASPELTLRDSSAAMPLQGNILYVYPPAGLAMQMDSLQLQSIKPIIREGIHWTDYLSILYVVLLFLIVAAAVWWIIRRKAKENDELTYQEPVVVIPAHEKAIAALTALDQQELWQKGMVKPYQSQLTKIMRTYLDDRYNIPALEMTTSDIKRQLVQEGVSDDLVKSMTDIMQIADIVKFAKGDVGPELNQKFMADALTWVHTTKEIESVAE